MKHLIGVHHSQAVLLLAAAMVLAHSLEASSYNLANERSSIERTYELTKYLEHQLKEIKDTYLSYLGPPFNEKDFSPPRPNSTALSLPSAATRLELWRGLENRARLAQNQRAYSVLLAAVQELARSTLCPYLQTSLLHFCTGLDGLLVSISGLMSGLGHAPPPPPGLALGGGALVGEEVAAGPLRRPAPLLMSQRGALGAVAARDGRYSYNLNYRPADTVRREDSLEHSLEDSLEDSLEHSLKDSLEDHLEDSLENSLDQRLGDSLEDSSDTALSDFARKVEGFWILRELQSWLWRSAKDFNRLKKRLRG
ncbi:cardiotrophin-like cytokine factor 1 [Gadus chalcogrammus]|uniref:cardiotrophin-like cytokine factor 1 n=1 Tax=Gadus chalcogrammus TaxID=1042646 RepID=UPI0024C4D5ED|nr:cardiotrophin-like cytokine factor 1 [Gadus chalcogrammus]